MKSEEKRKRLMETTESDAKHLRDIFETLSFWRGDASAPNGSAKPPAKIRALQYDRLVEFIQEKDKPADKRGVMKLLAKMEHIEERVEKVLEKKGRH